MSFYADANDSLTAAIYAPDPAARIIHERAHGMPRGASEYQPLRALMLAVLEDGIACYQGYFFQPTAADKRLFLEAEEWIRSNDEDIFSFNNICDTLGLDPGRIRKGLEQWRSGQAGKPLSDRRRLVANKARGKGTGAVKLFARGSDEEQRRAQAGGRARIVLPGINKKRRPSPIGGAGYDSVEESHGLEL